MINLLALLGKKIARRCTACGRILHPDRDGNLPLHKVPTPAGTYGNKAIPLTGPDAPWCRIFTQ